MQSIIPAPVRSRSALTSCAEISDTWRSLGSRRLGLGFRGLGGGVWLRFGFRGFGGGLALSRMILDAHGTTLELDSAPGKGSRFSFALAPFA